MKILSKVTVAVAALALVLGTASAASALTYTGTLKVGSRGAAVSSLQTCLNGKGMSAGVADGIFGMGTKAAVMRFQSANSLAVDGIAGMATHAALGNCSTTVVPNDDNNDDNGDVDLNDFIIQGGDEASIDDFDVNDGQDSDVNEGQEDQEVAEITVSWKDSDVLIERFDILSISQDANTGSFDPEDVFDSITLFLNGDEIDTIDTSRSSAWDEDNYGNEDDFGYTSTDAVRSLRFSGINEIIEEGDDAVFTVEATIANSVDNAPESWDFYVPVNGIRYVDTAGISGYAGSDTQSATVTIDEEGADNELTVTTGDDNPDSTTLAVENSARSSEYTLLAFDIESDTDSTEEIEISELGFQATVGAADWEEVVYETTLVGGGINQDVDEIIVTPTTGTPCDLSGAYTEGASTPCLVFEFDSEDLLIGEGDTETFELSVKFNQLTGNYLAGETVDVDFNGDDMDAEGLDSGEPVDLNGSANGEEHELRVDGLDVTVDSITYANVTTQTGTITSVDYFITLDIAAFGDTFYVPEEAATAAAALVGFEYALENSPSQNAPLSSSGILSNSTANVDDDGSGDPFRRIDENDSEKFTVKVTVNAEVSPDSIGNTRVQMDAVYATTDIGPAIPTLVAFALAPSQDFETDYQSISYDF